MLSEQGVITASGKARHWLHLHADLDGFFFSFGLEGASSLALLVLHLLLHRLHLCCTLLLQSLCHNILSATQYCHIANQLSKAKKEWILHDL